MRRHPASPARIVFSSFLALAVAMGIGRFAFTPLLPMMMDDTGVTLAQGGWLATANYAGYLLGALSAGWLPARHESPAIRAALLAVVLSTAAMACTTAFAAWMLWRAVAGVASAWLMVHVSAWALRELAARGRAGLSARVYGGVGAGIAAAGLLVLVLAPRGYASAAAWMACGLLALLMSAAAWPGFQVSAEVPAARPAPDGGSPYGARLVLCYGAYGLGYIIPATFLPALAREAMPDPAVFSWVWPLFGAVALTSTLAAERLQRRFSPPALWVGSHLLIAAGVLLLFLPHSRLAILLSATCVGGSFMVVTVAGFQFARQLAGSGATRLIAAMTAAFALGQIAGPLLLAWSERDLGVGASLALAAFALLAGAWALWRIPAPAIGRRTAPTTEPDAAR